MGEPVYSKGTVRTTATARRNGEEIRD